MAGREQSLPRSESSRRGRIRRPPLIFLLVLVFLSSALLMLVARRPAGESRILETKADHSAGGTVSKPENPASFPVHLDGAVARPGLYYLKDGAILAEAVDRAGGLLAEADSGFINLAMKLSPHMKVYIPRVGEMAPPEPMSEDNARVDLNRAGEAELTSLPGIGQATARAIIAYREAQGPFQVIEDLMKVPGIKEGRFAGLKDLVCVSGP